MLSRSTVPTWQVLGLTFVAGVFAIEALISLLSAAMPAQHRLYYALVAGEPTVNVGCVLALLGASERARIWFTLASVASLVGTVVMVGDFTHGFLTSSQVVSAPLAWHVFDCADGAKFFTIAYGARAFRTPRH